MRDEPLSPDTALYGLDIETDTAVDGLDPSVARIVAVAVSAPEGDRVFDDRDEARLLDRLDWHLAALPAGVLCTWNGARFDLPYLAARAERHGVHLGLRLEVDPTVPQHRDHTAPAPRHGVRGSWHGHAHLDAYRLYRADAVAALGVSGGLKSVARALGLTPVTVDVATLSRLGRREIADYVTSDARCTRLLVQRRWPACRGAVDHVCPRVAGCLPGAVDRSLLRARAATGGSAGSGRVRSGALR